MQLENKVHETNITRITSLKNEEIDVICMINKNLSVQEFIDTANFDINPLKMDIFWHSIQDDEKWIYVDKNIGIWMGLYKEQQGMGDVYKSLKKHVRDTKKYKIFESFNEFSEKYLMKIHHAFKRDEIESYREGNKAKYLIISPDAFKKWMARLQNEKGDEICDYFISLEKLFKYYVYYQKKIWT